MPTVTVDGQPIPDLPVLSPDENGLHLADEATADDWADTTVTMLASEVAALRSQDLDPQDYVGLSYTPDAKADPSALVVAPIQVPGGGLALLMQLRILLPQEAVQTIEGGANVVAASGDGKMRLKPPHEVLGMPARVRLVVKRTALGEHYAKQVEESVRKLVAERDADAG